MTIRRPFKSFAVVASLALAPRGIAQGFATVPVSTEAKAIAVGDLNGDGHSDLVIANETPPTVSILLGDGSGGFPTIASFPCGNSSVVTALATGDFDNDGNVDVVVGGNYVLLGDGQGGVGTPTLFDISGGVTSLSANDVDQDGDLDLLTGIMTHVEYNYPNPTIVFDPGGFKIQLGDGTGGFAPPQLITMGGSYKFTYPIFTEQYFTTEVLWADVNGDSVLDAVGNLWGWISSAGGPIQSLSTQVRLGASGGLFGPLVATTIVPWQSLDSNAVKKRLTLGDFTGDGLADLGTGTAQMFLSNGNGTFGAPTQLFLDSYNAVLPVWLADINGDGRADVLASDIVIQDASVHLVTWLALPGNAFSPSAAVVGLPAYPLAVAATDIDSNGRSDVVVLCPGAGQACILLGNGAGGFEGPAAFREWQPSNVGVTGGRIALTADVDEDGLRDLIGADSQQAYVALGSGSGSFASASIILFGSELTGGAAADFNRDGHVDLAICDSTISRVSNLRGAGNGTFVTVSASPTGAGPVDIAAGDLSGDGFPDVATADFLGESVSVLIGGSTGFAPHVDAVSDAGTCAVALGDLNSDGMLDIVAANFSSSSLCVFLGSGGGAIGPKTTFATSVGPVDVELGDVNGDGALDVVVSAATSHRITLHVGDAAGGLGGAIENYCQSPGDLKLADFNGDGLLDIVTGRSVGSPTHLDQYVAILVGRGGGTFSPAASLRASNFGFQYSRVAVADIDCDGRIDLALHGEPETKAYVRLNSTGSPFGMLASGSGTHGCTGVHGIAANVAAKIGKPGFTIACTNAPPNSLGLAIVADASSVVALDPFGIGVIFYVDLLNANYVSAMDIVSDRNGYALANEPIPALPIFAGVTVHTQVFWAWFDGCTPSPFALSSSRVLTTAFQP